MDLSTFLNVGIVGLAVWLVSRLVVSRSASARENLLARRLTGRETDPGAAAAAGSLVERTQKRSLRSIASVLAKPLEGSEYDRTQLAMKLARAGFRQEGAVAIFLAARFIGAAVGLAVGWIGVKFGSMPPVSVTSLLTWVIGGFCLGFMVPQLWLGLAQSSRSTKIRNSLPDSLDMLVIMVEAGLGLDAGIQRCSDEMQKAYHEIADEWRLASRETQMGLSRSEAMKKMAERTGVHEMQSLVAILNQAEKFGTSVATALRVHAESLRVKRHQEAEERAAKTAVKLIFPLILCIFPTIFIVLAGPAAMKIAKMFK